MCTTFVMYITSQFSGILKKIQTFLKYLTHSTAVASNNFFHFIIFSLQTCFIIGLNFFPGRSVCLSVCLSVGYSVGRSVNLSVHSPSFRTPPPALTLREGMLVSQNTYFISTPDPYKIEKNQCVLKCILGNFQCFEPMFS